MCLPLTQSKCAGVLSAGGEDAGEDGSTSATRAGGDALAAGNGVGGAGSAGGGVRAAGVGGKGFGSGVGEGAGSAGGGALAAGVGGEGFGSGAIRRGGLASHRGDRRSFAARARRRSAFGLAANFDKNPTTHSATSHGIGLVSIRFRHALAAA